MFSISYKLKHPSALLQEYPRPDRSGRTQLRRHMGTLHLLQEGDPREQGQTDHEILQVDLLLLALLVGLVQFKPLE
jgi:hypothetical protein